MNKGKVFKDGDIKIIDLRDLNFTTDTPDDAILTSKAKDIKDLIVRVKELESSNNKLKNGIKVLDEIIRGYIGSEEELEDKVKELEFALNYSLDQQDLDAKYIRALRSKKIKLGAKVKELEKVIRLMAGTISTMPEWSSRHPEDVLDNYFKYAKEAGE